MMYCQQLALSGFKNYAEARLDFSPKFNCFTGPNGAGKTNLLDAIYYLSFCKSFANASDMQNIAHEQEFFIIKGSYQINDRENELYCSQKRNTRKIFRRNKKDYERLSDHIGLFPLVLLSPGDTQLIQGGSDDRRKFLDGVISQYDKEYLQSLLSYNKALQQRNALLKLFSETGGFDPGQLEIWDEQLIRFGKYIAEARKSFFDSFLPVFQQEYLSLASGMEQVSIALETNVSPNTYAQELSRALTKDRRAQFTTVGIHKDDLRFLIQDLPVKKFGSQGQQKSYIIALRLAQYAFTRQVKGFAPILVFDDLFDKLDQQRVEQLMHMVSQPEYGQVFISDTHRDRMESLFKGINAECRIFYIEKGKVLFENRLNAPEQSQTGFDDQGSES